MGIMLLLMLVGAVFAYLILYLVVKAAVRDGIWESQGAASNIPCPACGKLHEMDAAVCPHCGQGNLIP